MRSNAVGGVTRTLCLAWEVAIMMPLQYLTYYDRMYCLAESLVIDVLLTKTERMRFGSYFLMDPHSLALLDPDLDSIVLLL
jgi:hypothetical protein